jgi:nucleoporin NUP42
VQQNTFAQNQAQPPNTLGPADSTTNTNPFSKGISEPFGASSPAAKTLFGQSPIQAMATTGNPFSNPLPSASNPLGQNFSVQEANSKPFGNALPNSSVTTGRFDIAPSGHQLGGSSQAFVNGNAIVGSNDSIQQLPLDAYSSRDSSGRLAVFKGMRVTYKDDKAGYRGSDGTWHKIWFPQGAPAPFKDTEMEGLAYDESIKRAYMHALQSGTFQGGVIPAVPPKREWCLYDF